MICRNYKDTASAICNFILSITDEESLGWVLPLFFIVLLDWICRQTIWCFCEVQ
jgi:hypothetical protein